MKDSLDITLKSSYKNLKELILDNGILTDTIDHSDLALQMREEISRNLDKSDNDLY